MEACPTSESTAISSRTTPHMKFSPSSPFDIATITIPTRDSIMPVMFIRLIFSLKKKMPAPMENIGIVAIIIALRVGEPVSLSP